MGEVSTIGVDIAKSVFQVHGVDASGAVVIRRRIGRAKVLDFFAELPPCLVGMEACATAHQWARELKKLGHDTRLMPPTYVKAYVKRGKNDAADAAAICEAVTRPSMRFVPIKSFEQQSALMLHRTRDLLIRQRTQLINALHAHLAELGLVAAKGHEGLHQLVTAVVESSDERLPSDARFACQSIVAQLHAVQTQISWLDKRITQAHRANADSKRLDAIPGFGFPAHAVFEIGETGRVAPRPRQAVDEAGADRIGHIHKHDWDGASRLLHRPQGHAADSHDHVRRKRNQFRRISADESGLAAGRAIVDLQVSAHRPAQLLEALLEHNASCLLLRIIRREWHEHANSPNAIGLLCVRGERPPRRRPE
jgi:transposase